MVSKQIILTDLKQAMKAREAERVSTLRLLVTAIKNAEIEKKGEVSDEDIIRILTSEAKSRSESIEAYTKAKRQELVDKETQELELIQKYLPQQMSEKQVREFVKNFKDLKTVEGDFGKAMKLVMGKLKGKAQGKIVAEVIRQEL